MIKKEKPIFVSNYILQESHTSVAAVRQQTQGDYNIANYPIFSGVSESKNGKIKRNEHLTFFQFRIEQL